MKSWWVLRKPIWEEPRDYLRETLPRIEGGDLKYDVLTALFF